MIRFIIAAVFLHLASPIGACEDRLLVSDYSGNEVRVYNGCTGEYLQDLDGEARLSGPQSIRIGDDGLIYVVSEENARVVRYRAEDLSFVDIFIDGSGIGPIRRPTALLFHNDELLLAGYQSDNIGRFDRQTGEFKSLLATNIAGLDGPDAGMAIDTNGELLVPSFESSQLLRFDPDSGEFRGVLGDTSNGLNAPRVVLVDSQTGARWVTSWRNGRVVEIAADGSSRVVANTFRPSGLALNPNNGQLLVASDSSKVIFNLDPATGELTQFVQGGGNPLQAATFVTYLSRTANQVTQTNEQYWIVGDGPISDEFELLVSAAVTTQGGAFGDAFDPELVERPRWGEINIRFTDCNAAQLNWTSTGDNSADFGSGGYPLVRLLPNRGQADCEMVGFDNVSDVDWISGTWYGAESRDGEGLLIDVFDQRAFVAWFTYHRMQAEN